MRDQRHCRPRHAAALTAAALVASVLAVSPGKAQTQLGRQADASVILPTGQRITPAGTQVVLNSMPLTAELSPDGRYLLVLQAGFETPSVSVIDTSAAEVVSRVELPDAWLGLTFNRSGDRVYVGGGGRSSVWDLSFANGKLAVEREFPIRPRCPGDCAALIGDLRMDADDRMLYALDVFRDRAVVINTQSGLVLDEFRTGAAPYRARLAPDREHLVISHWGEASLGLYRLADRRLVERIPVGEHPTDIVVVPGQVQALASGPEGEEERTYADRLFTACAHSDNLWTHGITDENRFELLDVQSVAPLPGSPVGSIPSALGLSADRQTLLVANAGNNIVLVVDIEEALPEPGGAVPTGWYPTAVAGLANGGMAYASGKGDGQHPGLVSILPPLNADQLEFLSSAAVSNLPAPQTEAPASPSGIRQVVLVLTDARGKAWKRLLQESVFLAGYVPATRGELSRIAWLTAGMESDFFAKLGPSVSAGRLTARELAAAGRAALPPAGTLWANAINATLTAETYGIAGGRIPDTFFANLEEGAELARLTVVRLAGDATDQDIALERMLRVLREHRAYDTTAAFLVPTGISAGAAVTGGPISSGIRREGFVSSASVVRTIGWLLGLRPMTQFDAAAPLIDLSLSEVRQ